VSIGAFNDHITWVRTSQLIVDQIMDWWANIVPMTPVGFQKSAPVPDLVHYVARSYSLIKPPSAGLRFDPHTAEV
jgi:hypothetical protein